jgi:hypothetical protein
VKKNQTAVPRERTSFHMWRMEPVMREEIALTVFGIPSSTMNIFQWNNIIKEVSRCRVSIHETDIHGPNIGN